MPTTYLLIEDFKLGLDRRRSRETGVPGSLWTLVNAHITRGGEIERMKKPVPMHTLPADTFGMAPDRLTVFGSAAAPSMPAGVTYQRLQHPDGIAMSGVLDVEVFDGKLYVIAEFVDGTVHHFYDGTLVAAWNDGVVRAGMGTLDAMATQLAGFVDADAALSATAAGQVITITGPADATPFTVTATAVDGGNVDDQTATVETTVEPVEEVVGVTPTGSVTITSGSPNVAATGTVTLDVGAGGSVDSIFIDGVDILGSAVPFNTNLIQTAADVADQINSFASSPEYTATANGPVIEISASVESGEDMNGYAITVNTTTIDASGGFLSGGETNGVTSIKVDGVEILGETVAWETSHSAFASALAAKIDEYVSSPEYTGSTDGPKLIITPTTGPGTGANGRSVVVGTVGTVTVTTTNLAGGVNTVAAVPQQTTVKIGGTFDPGDRFGIIINDGETDMRVYGAAGNPGEVGRTAYAYGGKMYSSAGSILYFSDVNDATRWNREDVDRAGAGFLNASTQDSGAQEIVGVQEYQGQLAIFSRNSIQIWTMDPDPDMNVLTQRLQKTGTFAGKSALSYGALDVFYLHSSGVRSLRARDSSNAAYVNDVGIALDPEIRAYMKTLTAAQREAAIAVMESQDGRFWLAIGSRIYPFSYFPGSKINAWSYYDLGFTIEAFADISERIYARAGNTIYLFGGEDDETYPDAGEYPVTVEIPYLSANTPATKKSWHGIDVACTNDWQVRLLPSPTDDAVQYNAGIVTETTFNKPRHSAKLQSTHMGARLTCDKAGRATLAQIALHYQNPHEAG